MSEVVMIIAPAPSFIPDALAAVTVPSFLNTGRSFAIEPAASLSNRARFFGFPTGDNCGCSSIFTTVSPRRPFMVTGVISLS